MKLNEDIKLKGDSAKRKKSRKNYKKKLGIWILDGRGEKNACVIIKEISIHEKLKYFCCITLYY